MCDPFSFLAFSPCCWLKLSKSKNIYKGVNPDMFSPLLLPNKRCSNCKGFLQVWILSHHQNTLNKDNANFSKSWTEAIPKPNLRSCCFTLPMLKNSQGFSLHNEQLKQLSQFPPKQTCRNRFALRKCPCIHPQAYHHQQTQPCCAHGLWDQFGLIYLFQVVIFILKAPPLKGSIFRFCIELKNWKTNTLSNMFWFLHVLHCFGQVEMN